MQLFEHTIKTETMAFKHASGKSVETGTEFHTYHEIILLFNGDVELITEGIHMSLKPNMLIVIPKETYHQVIIHGEQDHYHRCVLHFLSTPALLPFMEKSMQKPAVMEMDRNMEYLFQKLIEHTKQDIGNALLQAVLILLLNEIESKTNVHTVEHSQNHDVSRAISFINANLHSSLTIQEIAQHCSISPSTLSLIFKRDMKMPVHKFVVKKRLINAHHKITNGMPAAEAAMECGFNDYSGFYKQYKKMFGFSPSQKRA